MKTMTRLKNGIPILEPHGKIVVSCGIGIARETRVRVIRRFRYTLLSHQFRACSQDR